MAYGELDIEPVPLKMKGKETPETKKVPRSIRLRSTILGAEIKRRYNHLCQVCRTTVRLAGIERYAEAHHLKPLGSPHLGPDVPGNIIVLCPNHHVMFDRGAATVSPATPEILHATGRLFRKKKRLYLESWHLLRKACLKYHHDRIFKGR